MTESKLIDVSKFKEGFNLLHELDNRFTNMSYCQRYDSFLLIPIIVIETEYQHKGLFTNFIKDCIDFYSVIKIHSPSETVLRICSGLGFHKIKELDITVLIFEKEK